jgi:hypothetical protein
MNAPCAASFELLVPSSQAREKVRAALWLHVGRGRRYSVKQLYEGTGVPAASIEKAMLPVENYNHRALKHEELLSIAKFLGAPFASAYLELAGLGAFELADGQIPLPKVLVTAVQGEDVAEERRRLIQRLAELEGVA